MSHVITNNSSTHPQQAVTPKNSYRISHSKVNDLKKKLGILIINKFKEKEYVNNISRVRFF